MCYENTRRSFHFLVRARSCENLPLGTLADIASVEVDARESEHIGAVLTAPSPQKEVVIVFEPGDQFVLLHSGVSISGFAGSLHQDQRRPIPGANFNRRRRRFLVENAKVFWFENHGGATLILKDVSVVEQVKVR